MQALNMMTKILANGNKIVVANRKGNRIIQVFTENGALYKTKVKNIKRQNVGSKEVITKKELFYEGEQHYATDVRQITTDRVYNSTGELLGMRKYSMINDDTCNHDLRSIINNMKNFKDTTIIKKFLTPQGQVYKNVRYEYLEPNLLRTNITYFPNKYGVGHHVSANEHGIVQQQIAGLDFLF